VQQPNQTVPSRRRIKTRMLPHRNADTSSILLSSNISGGASWDPGNLVLGDVALSNAASRRGRRVSSVRGKFIAGPIDIVWLSQARKLGLTALWVGLGLWFLRGLRRSDTNIVSNLTMQEWDVEPDAKTRALRTLEKAGLVTVERRGKRSPRVTLIVQSTKAAA
jgi:DNA-binding transcriptional ArsR family regulator